MQWTDTLMANMVLLDKTMVGRLHYSQSAKCTANPQAKLTAKLMLCIHSMKLSKDDACLLLIISSNLMHLTNGLLHSFPTLGYYQQWKRTPRRCKIWPLMMEQMVPQNVSQIRIHRARPPRHNLKTALNQITPRCNISAPPYYTPSTPHNGAQPHTFVSV